MCGFGRGLVQVRQGFQLCSPIESHCRCLCDQVYLLRDPHVAPRTVPIYPLMVHSYYFFEGEV
jgi:hypothetical protein